MSGTITRVEEGEHYSAGGCMSMYVHNKQFVVVLYFCEFSRRIVSHMSLHKVRTPLIYGILGLLF